MRAAGDPDLKVYGIFGYPLGHTVSPAIQNCALDYYGLQSIYFAFERPSARFRFLMRHLKSLLLDGFNVTIPYKEEVVRYLDRLSPEAKILGAVNTVKKQGKKWIGYNTDLYGFLKGLKEAGFNPKNKRAVVLGAGGSARAVVFGLAGSGIRQLTIFNRTPERAKRIVNQYKKKFPKINWAVYRLDNRRLKEALSAANLLVNTTQVGLKPSDPLLVSKSIFPKNKILVYDLIYKPKQTKLLQLASKLGHQTINGETMLLHQGTRAFELWTGKHAPVREMKKALNDALHSH